VVDIKWKPERRADQLRWQCRGILPWPFADECEPVTGENTRLTQTAALKEPRARAGNRFLVSGKTCGPESRITLNGGIDITRGCVVIALPRSVGTLFVKNRGDHPVELSVVLDTEKMHRQNPLRFHAGIRFQHSDPKPFRILPLKQPVDR